MTIYFFVLYFALGLCIVNEYVLASKISIGRASFLKRNALYILAGIVIISLSLLRSDSLGIDLYMYEDAFSSYISGTLFNPELAAKDNGLNVFYKFELANQLLIVAIGKFTSNFTIYKGIFSLLMLGIPLYVLKKETRRHLWLGVLVFMGSFYAISFSILRYGMAVVFCILAFHLLYIDSKKHWGYICLVIAVLFHTTAIILAFAVLLFRFRYKLWVYISAIVGSVLIFFAYKPLFQILMYLLRDTKYNIYANMLDAPLDFALNNICLFGLVTLLCFVLRDDLLAKNEKNILFMNMSLFMLVFNICFSWLPEYGRICFSFEMFLMFLLPNIALCIKNRKIKITYFAFFLLYYSYIFYDRLFINRIVPYVSLFS